jgi:hypothetical protein
MAPIARESIHQLVRPTTCAFSLMTRSAVSRVHVISVLLGVGTPLFRRLDSAIRLGRIRGACHPGRHAPGGPGPANVVTRSRLPRGPDEFWCWRWS